MKQTESDDKENLKMSISRAQSTSLLEIDLLLLLRDIFEINILPLWKQNF